MKNHIRLVKKVSKEWCYSNMLHLSYFLPCFTSLHAFSSNSYTHASRTTPSLELNEVKLFVLPLQQDVSGTGLDLKLCTLKLSCKSFMIKWMQYFVKSLVGPSPSVWCYVVDVGEITSDRQMKCSKHKLINPLKQLKFQ